MANVQAAFQSRSEGTATAHSWDNSFPTLPSPQYFRDFTVEDMIGEGRFGTVWRCTHRRTGTQFACKQVNKTKEPQALQHEVENFARVQGHPNLVSLEGVYESAESLYLVTELCNGGDLYDFLGRQGHLGEHEAKDLFRQLAQAVHHCHSRGVIHRDIKPENVLLHTSPATGQTTVKLADFGLAVALSSGEKVVGWVGSEPYEAPEVIACRPYDSKADVFSLGVVLFSLLSGMWPTFREGRFFDAESEFSGPGWEAVSLEAKNLISSMLSVEESARPLVAAVLGTPWLATPAIDFDSCGYTLEGDWPMEPALEHVSQTEKKLPEVEELLSDLLATWEPLTLSELIGPGNSGAVETDIASWEMAVESEDLGLASPEAHSVEFPWVGSQLLSPSSWSSGDGADFEAFSALRSCSFNC